MNHFGPPGEPITGPSPVLSIAIATRNYGRYLTRALESVFRAASHLKVPYEIVLVDDASTDETPELLERFRLQYPRHVKVVRRSTTRGVPVAKNTALAHCSGRFVALLDADDEFHEGKLAECYERLRDGSVEFVTHDFVHWWGPGEEHLRNQASWMGAAYDFWPPSTWAFRNGRVWFNEQMIGSAEDLEWLARQRMGKHRRHVDVALTTMYAHRDSTGQASDGLVAANQITGRLTGRPHPDDGRALMVWVCSRCGRQLLQHGPCCGSALRPLPLYHYSFVESPRCRGITPEFSFIFLTKDQVDVTRSAVETLLPRLEGTSFELIFVDGGSTDETVPAIRAWAERYPVKLISVLPEETFNYSRNCNRGARAALGKYLLLANNDVEFHSDALVPGLRAALADPRVGVVGVSTCWRAWHRDPSWDTTEAAYLFTERPFPGFFWGMRREVYWELGALDEAFAGYGYDELDFQYRALLNHYRLALVAGGVVHRKSMTFKAVFGSSAMSVMEKFNHDVFEGKHGCGMYVSGDHVEPFARHRPPTLSIVTVASDAGSALRRSLESAIGEQRSRDGSVQWVVVDNGSSDDTALVMWEYRRRLPRLVTPLRLEQPLPAPRALAMARTRAVGRQLLVLEPGQPLPVAPAER